MCVGRHGGVPSALGTFDEYVETLRQLRPQLINGDPDIQPKIGGNLLVAAAAAVEFVSRVADKMDKILLYEVMNIFSFGVLKKRWRDGRLLGNLFQTLQNRNKLT